jgi:hypothetical protein
MPAFFVGVKPFSPHVLRDLHAIKMLKAGAKLEIVGGYWGTPSG